MTPIPQFTREEMQALVSKARTNAEAVVNQEWKWAFENLAHAASIVDAFIARSTNYQSQPTAPAAGKPTAAA